MDIVKTIDSINKIFTAVRKGQLIIEKQEKIKTILTKNQIEKTILDKYLGPKKPRRGRFKKVT